MARANADLISSFGNANLWNQEYGHLAAIPSSFRTSPARALIAARGALASISDGRSLRVLDAGSGTGRQAIWLAKLGHKVHAVDVSEVACNVLAETIQLMKLTGLNVEHGEVAVDADLGGPYDLILDSYVSCHLLDEGRRRRYLPGLRRCLSPEGQLVTIAMGSADEYYARQILGDSGSLVALDPLNSVPKLLQNAQEFETQLADLGPLQNSGRVEFDDVVNGRVERREVLIGILGS